MSVAEAEAPKPEVLLIDLSSLFWTAWHSSGADEISQARIRTLDAIQRCIGDEGRLVAICCDMGRSFRKDLSPQYKAQRPEKDHASLGELDRVKQKLRDDGFLLWEAPGFEADDIIATATVAAIEAGHAVLIAGSDKDLLQLLWKDNIRALRTHNWTIVGEKEVTAKFGVRPDQLGDWLALVGDKVDNIKGAPGIGDARATGLLSQWESLDGIWEALEIDATKVATPAIVKSLRENREAVRLARKLVALRTDAPIKWDEIYETREPVRPAALEGMDMDATDAEYDAATPGPVNGVAATPAAEAKPKDAEAAAPAPEKTPGPSAMVQYAAPNVPFELALEPISLGVAFKLGQQLYASRLYTRFLTPEAITAVIIRGREMGIPALTALDVFHVIEGKPAPHAHLIISQGTNHPDCEYFMLTHSDNESATYETKNKKHPKPISHTYSIQDAIDAGLCKLEIEPRTAGPKEKDSRGQWDKRRAEMLRKTAGVQLVRIAYPSAAMGLYSVEELGGE